MRALWAGLALVALTGCAVVDVDPAARFATLDEAEQAISARLYGLDIARPEQVPTTGRARFEGVGVVVIEPPDKQMRLLGDLVVDVDFGAGTASARMSNVVGRTVGRIEGEGETQVFGGTVTFSNGHVGALVNTGDDIGSPYASTQIGGLRFDVAGRLGNASDLVEVSGTLEAFFWAAPDGPAGTGVGLGRRDVQATLNGTNVRVFMGMTTD